MVYWVKRLVVSYAVYLVAALLLFKLYSILYVQGRMSFPISYWVFVLDKFVVYSVPAIAAVAAVGFKSRRLFPLVVAMSVLVPTVFMATGIRRVSVRVFRSDFVGYQYGPISEVQTTAWQWIEAYSRLFFQIFFSAYRGIDRYSGVLRDSTAECIALVWAAHPPSALAATPFKGGIWLGGIRDG